jgi:hypothetical protein
LTFSLPNNINVKVFVLKATLALTEHEQIIWIHIDEDMSLNTVPQRHSHNYKYTELHKMQPSIAGVTTI